MVGREVDGPLCAVLGLSWDLCWWSWGGLGTYVGGPGLLPGLYGRSWAALGASKAGLGLLLEPMLAVLGPLLGPMLAVLGRTWPSSGGLRPLLGPMLAVLSRSWALCWRSWVALGTYVGGPGGSKAEKWLKPEREREGPPRRHRRRRRHRPPQAICQLMFLDIFGDFFRI